MPDPRSARSPQEFLQRMVELRLWAGNPSLRMLRRMAGTTTAASGETIDALPESTTSYLLNGRSLPRPPRLEFVEAFVAACLAVRQHPEDEVTGQVERWREAWRNLATRAEPQQDAPVGPTSVPAQAQAADPAAAAAASSSRRRRSVLVAAGVLLLVVAAGVLAYEREGGEPRVLAGAVLGDLVPELHRGSVRAMRDTEGLDLDQGRLASQNIQGIDVTAWGQGNHLVTKSGATMALLDAPGPETYRRCAAVPAERMGTTVRGLYDLRAPRNLCVWTREGRIAMLTLDETPSVRTGTLALHYVVWQPRGG